ncbi:hypothetical protein [Microbacterium invictum]|uniref:Uncharacterized protein n=1 Tax=Microbacterium invictum TaxID=515415 RepID=A0AA40VN13_9MICO|nr:MULTISPECIES: hypothetical protein [Microbacterium]MBB4139893.1 hypothetical protein [Microbacterium invictum]
MTATPVIDYVPGEVRPSAAHDCSPEKVAALLRARNLLASVGRDALDSLGAAAGLTIEQLPVQLCLAVTGDQRVLVSTADGPAPGPALADVVVELARATGCEADIAGEYASGDDDAGDEAAPDDTLGDDDSEAGLHWVDVTDDQTLTDVVICRAGTDALPLLARDVSSPLRAARVGEYLIVQFTAENSDQHEHGWMAGEGPVIALSGFGGDRYVSVLVGRGVLPGQATLARTATLTPVFAPGEVASATVPILEMLGDPHRQPDSQLSALRAEAPFAHVDAQAVSGALQSDDDAQWFARVLTAIGLPDDVAALAADVAEGGALPDAIEVEPLGLWAAIRDSLRRFDQDALDQTRRRGPLRRLHALSIRKPLAVLATVIPELAVGIPVLAWVWSSAPRPWWVIAAGVVAVLLIVDAVADLVLMTVRLRRRRARN